MIARRETPIERSCCLKLSVILIALLLSGCATLQPRLSFNQPPRNRAAAQPASRDGDFDKLPVEIFGAVERKGIEVGARIPIFVW